MQAEDSPLLAQVFSNIYNTNMKVITHIIDDQYPKTEITKQRHTARGIIFKDNKIGLVHVHGTDKFGTRDHYETPGGGIEKGESPEQALHREIQEELGYTIENVKEIGIISNDYNLISRCDIAHFFVADAKTFSSTHFTDEEKLLFEKPVWIDSSSIISIYEKALDEKNPECIKLSGRIIYNRDIIAIKEALKIHKTN